MRTVKYTPEPCSIIWLSISRAIHMAGWLQCNIKLCHNQYTIIITPQDTENTAVAKWDAKQTDNQA